MDKAYKTYILENGFKLFFIPMKNIDHAYVEFYVGTGEFSEISSNMIEVAHMLEHMQSNYTSSQHKNSKAVIKMIEDAGSFINASTRDSRTFYYTPCLSKYLHKILKVQLQSFVDFVLDKSVFKAEQNSVVEEIQTRYLNYAWCALLEKTNQILFPNIQRFKYNAAERIKLVKKITPQQVLDFRNKNYHPANMMIVVAGDFDCEKTKTIIEHHISKMPNPPLPIDLISHQTVIPQKFQGPLQIYVPNKKNENTRLEFTWTLPVSVDPSDVHTIEVLNVITQILTNGMDSRLLYILRTRMKFVYFVSMDVYPDYNGTGTVLIWTETSFTNKLKTIINIIKKEIKKLQTFLIRKSEFERLQNKSLLAILDNNMHQNPSKYADIYASYFFHDKPVVRIQDRVSVIKSMKRSDIQDVAKSIFVDKNLLIAYSGKQRCTDVPDIV